MIAFAATTAFNSEQIKDDPTMVKWVAMSWEVKDGIWTPTYLPMHKCSKEELDRFYEPRKD